MKWFSITTPLLVSLVLSVSQPRVAGASAQAPTVPDTIHAFTAQNFPLSGGVIEFSSPVLGDLNEDGKLDVVIGTTGLNGNDFKRNRPFVLAAIQGDGTELWSKTLDGPINSAPALGDIDGDGHLEVLVSTAGDASDRGHNGGLFAFDRNGNQLWRYSLADHDPKDGLQDGTFSTPSLCDVDGDGNLEIALGGWDQRIHLVDHTGNPIWFNLNRPANFPVDGGYYNADTIWSTAACADFNGDGLQEIVIGADITGGSGLPDGTRPSDGGFLFVFGKDGNVLVRRYLPEAIYSSPAVGDLNGDGQLEIVVGTGYYWWDRHGRSADSYVYAFNTANIFSGLAYADAAKLPDLAGWPQKTTYPGFSSPALADLDGDGDMEIIIGSGDPFKKTSDDIDGVGQVYAWHHNGSLVSGWPVSPKNVRNQDANIFSSPTVADVDGDGGLEVLFTTIWDINIYNTDGSFQERLTANWTVNGSPAVGDTDGDGKMDIWIGGGHAFGDKSSGHLWNFETSIVADGARPWPMFHRDAAHTGRFPSTARAALDGARYLALLFDPDKPTELTAFLQLVNKGGVPYNWQIKNKDSRVTAAPEQGSVNGDGLQNTVMKIDPSGLANGTYDLGHIEIEITSNGTPLPNSPIMVPVSLYVGPVQQSYLPLVDR